MNERGAAAGPSAPELVYRWVREFIISLPRDEDAFLNEVELAKMTQTSRTPVREALLRLETQGFVRRVPHKGVHVPRISNNEVVSILQARAVVEKWASANPSPATLEELESILKRQQESAGDISTFIALDAEFHTQLVETAQNPLLTDFYRSLRERQLRMGLQAVAGLPDRPGNVLREHAEILTALRSGDPAAIDDAIDVHLHSTQAAILGQVHGL